MAEWGLKPLLVAVVAEEAAAALQRQVAPWQRHPAGWLESPEWWTYPRNLTSRPGTGDRPGPGDRHVGLVGRPCSQSE